MTPVNNRRTLCDHCSFRKDLPGWIGIEHAQGNVDRVKQGDIFPCHQIFDPDKPQSERACAGAVLMADAPHLVPIDPNHPEVYDSLDDYLAVQTSNRVTEEELIGRADWWRDAQQRIWYGWWRQAEAGNWHYFLTNHEDLKSDSAYLFFEQCQQLFGPLEKVK